MFAVNLAMMLLACLSLPRRRDGSRRTVLIVGAISLVLASVVHVLVFLVGAIAVAAILLRAQRNAARGGPRSRLVILLVLIVGLSYLALPENVAGISRVAERAVDL